MQGPLRIVLMGHGIAKVDQQAVPEIRGTRQTYGALRAAPASGKDPPVALLAPAKVATDTSASVATTTG